VHTTLGSFLPPALTPSLTTHTELCELLATTASANKQTGPPRAEPHPGSKCTGYTTRIMPVVYVTKFKAHKIKIMTHTQSALWRTLHGIHLVDTGTSLLQQLKLRLHLCKRGCVDVETLWRHQGEAGKINSRGDGVMAS
jgi:hypothetical protein